MPFLASFFLDLVIYIKSYDKEINEKTSYEETSEYPAYTILDLHTLDKIGEYKCEVYSDKNEDFIKFF